MTIATLWSEFRTESLPENAPPHQIKAMEMAFMAGLSAAIHEASRIPDGSKQPTLRLIMFNINSMRREIQEWAMQAKFRA